MAGRRRTTPSMPYEKLAGAKLSGTDPQGARAPREKAKPPVVLYHGTFKPFVPSILKDGLTPATGWGGANTTGVFLSGSPEGARYWGRYAAASNLDLDGDGDADFDGNAERYERRFPSLPHVQVLRVTVPANKVKNLRADMEQAEDVGFEGGAADWQESLAAIGDVMYAGPIPAAWIEVFQTQPAKVLSAKKIAEARIALNAYNIVVRAGDWEVPESVHEAVRTLRSKGPETTEADVEPLMAWHKEALKQNPRRKHKGSTGVSVVGQSRSAARRNPASMYSRTGSDGRPYSVIYVPGTYSSEVHVQFSETDWSRPGAPKTLRILPSSVGNRGVIVRDLMGHSLTSDDLLNAAISAEEAAERMFTSYPQYQYRDAAHYYEGLAEVLTDLASSLQAGWRTNGKRR